MAHIANCIAEQEQVSISKPASPVAPPDSATSEEKPFVFRMQQPEQARKYQLFPKEKPLPALNSGKQPDLASSPIESSAGSTSKAQFVERGERLAHSAGLKIKISAQNLIRRRKVSVPELGPMTTVQEISMDSPTIPGRPALHERSISAPGRSGRKFETSEDATSMSYVDAADDELDAVIDEAINGAAEAHFSPKQLTRLIIPEAKAPYYVPEVRPMRSFSSLRSGTLQMEPRPLRTDASPKARTPFSPASSMSDLTTPRSALTNAASTNTNATPLSASAIEISRASPKPWAGERRCVTPSDTERTTTPQPDDPVGTISGYGHRRGQSESSSIMDRGRPRKRTDLRLQHNASVADLKAAASRGTERKAFEELPTGYKPAEAAKFMDPADLKTLYKQAMGQAERFEVLRPEDVEGLSKELRRLDERCEYLRKTYNSLRAGRRNLHSRICQYLRSPRVAKFSGDSMLKQEEALAELDASIDDWVNKLEKAENRRTRVRQKLLEHVAAATLIPVSPSTQQASGSLQQVVGINDVSTPPRSPSKIAFSERQGNASPSPQRVVAQVPSTIFEHPKIEDDAEGNRFSQKSKLSSFSHRRAGTDTESIRIYAGDDVYALLADVENEISKMSSDNYMADLPEATRTQLHRQQSHEQLTHTDSPVKKEVYAPAPISPLPPTPPMKDEINLTLSNAVFRP